MKKKKEKVSIWFYIGLISFSGLLVGTVNGVRELFNSTVTIRLSEYMKEPCGSSKLVLTNCKIDNGASVKVVKRRRGSGRERVVDRYYLLIPKEKVVLPEVYVFVNDGDVGYNSNASEAYERATLDNKGFHGIQGWTELISIPGLKSDMKELVMNKDADIVVITRGIESIALSVTYPFSLGFGGILILIVRAFIKSKIAKRKELKAMKQNC